MHFPPKHSSIIALAWPETKVRKVGVWYDSIMKSIGVQKGDYYKVGHAAFLLINEETSLVHYFDFGRYHTPRKTGRVRDAETDIELTIQTKARFSREGYIQNIKSILCEVAKNRATHGDGHMLASIYSGIEFQLAFAKAKEMQNKGAISYGPFDLSGTNCSRFVAQVTRAGNPDLLTKLLINLPYTISPSPISNIKVINNHSIFYKANKTGEVVEIERNLLKIKKVLFPKISNGLSFNYKDLELW